MSVGAILANRERPLQVILATSIPLLFLSGAVYPREAIPVPLQALAALVPSTPGINGFIKLNQMGAYWREIQPEVFLMTGLLLLYGLIAWLLLSWRAGHLSGAVLPAETEQDPQA
jgi:ABC-2 type transport system permease protein